MRLCANENIPEDCVLRLRQDGHDVLWIREAAPGIPDNAVLARAAAPAPSGGEGRGEGGLESMERSCLTMALLSPALLLGGRRGSSLFLIRGPSQDAPYLV